MKSIKETVTKERMEELDLEAKLIDISRAVMDIDVPTNEAQSKTIARARCLAATELHRLGYSYRQIMGALGLKSPQSVSQYLSPPKP